LRNARRRRHFEDQDWTDTAYKAYMGLIVAGLATFYLSPVFGEGPASATFLREVHDRGASTLGLIIAVGLLLGLRSGARGGPLALEESTVVHVLLAPISRGTALRSAALSQLRGIVFGSALAGAVAGTLASHRLPGSDASWIAAGAGLGVLVGLVVWGAALVGSGLRISMRAITCIAAVFIVWASVDVAVGTETSPTSQLGRVGLAPLHWSSWAPVGIALAIIVPIIGLAVVGGMSLEHAQHRASLVGQLRFAATLQDIRTVMVLHRQLAQERPRTQPWWQVDTRRNGDPCRRRDWQGIARWPAMRAGRAFALSAIAGFALAGAWNGAASLVLVAGAVLFVAGLDATEGLAQETDHLERPTGYPVAWGSLIVRHLVVPTIVLAAVELPALAIFVAVAQSATAFWVALLALILTTVAASIGAALTLVLGAPPADAMFRYGLPELATVVVAVRQLFPVAITVGALVPVAILSHEQTENLGLAVTVGLGVVGVVIAVFIWLRSRRLELA
jgi:hypothetical protein